MNKALPVVKLRDIISFILSGSRGRRQASTPENVAPDESFDISALHSNKTTTRILNETGLGTLLHHSSDEEFVVKRMSYLYVAYVHKMFSVIACSYKKSIDDIKMFIKLGKPIRKQISSRTRSSLYNGKFAEFNVSDVRIKFPLIQTVGQL